MFEVAISIFVAGVMFIALEDVFKINKTVVALLMAVLLWSLLYAFAPEGTDLDLIFSEELGDTSKTLFLVLGALALIDLTDKHGGFNIISEAIKVNNKRKMLWIIGLMTFFFSAILDNIATAVIIIALLRKFIPDREQRIPFSCMTVIAANAGGSFSPIGDVTTLLLWQKGNISALHQITSLFLPSLACLVVPLGIATFFFRKDEKLPEFNEEVSKQIASQFPIVGKLTQMFVFIVAVGTMIAVPLLQSPTTLPSFMIIMVGICILWIFTDLMYRYRESHQIIGVKISMTDVLQKVDIATILFFLGILMSVGALKESGQLVILGDLLREHISKPLGISFVIGMLSSLVDNVALVAATQGMYPLAATGAFVPDSPFWTFLAYCGVTGGSIFIIGSATGVSIMGLEKISFMYYLKRFTVLALIGYFAGAGVFLLLM